MPLDKINVIPMPIVGNYIKDGEYEDKGSHWITQAGGRPIIMVDYHGVKVPMYGSTNSGGKEETDAGKWYPFFGIHPEDKWINKTHGADMADYYGSQELRDIAESLDKHVGSRVVPTGRTHEETGKPIFTADPKLPMAGKGGKHTSLSGPMDAAREIINGAMTHPIARRDEGHLVRANIADLTDRLAVARLKASRVGAFSEGMSPSQAVPRNQASAIAQDLEGYASHTGPRIQELDTPLNLDGR